MPHLNAHPIGPPKDVWLCKVSQSGFDRLVHGLLHILAATQTIENPNDTVDMIILRLPMCTGKAFQYGISRKKAVTHQRKT